MSVEFNIDHPPALYWRGLATLDDLTQADKDVALKLGEAIIDAQKLLIDWPNAAKMFDGIGRTAMAVKPRRGRSAAVQLLQSNGLVKIAHDGETLTARLSPLGDLVKLAWERETLRAYAPQ